MSGDGELLLCFRWREWGGGRRRDGYHEETGCIGFADGERGTGPAKIDSIDSVRDLFSRSSSCEDVGEPRQVDAAAVTLVPGFASLRPCGRRGRFMGTLWTSSRDHTELSFPRSRPGPLTSQSCSRKDLSRRRAERVGR